MSTTVEQTIEVDVPIETAYNQWTQFPEGLKEKVDERPAGAEDVLFVDALASSDG